MISDRDLRDLFDRKAEDVNINRGMPPELLKRVRRRQAVVAAASAVILVALVAVAWMGAGPLVRTEATKPADENGAPVDGLAPTQESLAGIWLRDSTGREARDAGGSGMLLRFSPDGTFAIDDGGFLDTRPAALGTFEIDGEMIIHTSSGSEACTEGDVWAWRATLPEDGRLDIVMVEDADPACSIGVGTEWSFTRVSPTSPAGARITAADPEEEGTPLMSSSSVRGIWLLEGGETLLRSSRDGTYAVDDAGRLGVDPGDVGTFEIRQRGTLTFTSGPESRICDEGDRQMWRQVRIGRRTLRAVVAENECTDNAGAEQTWIALSP